MKKYAVAMVQDEEPAIPTIGFYEANNNREAAEAMQREFEGPDDLNPLEESEDNDEVFQDCGMGIWYTVKEIV